MLIYNLSIHVYGLLIRLAALRNKKAKQWVRGRANWREKLKAGINGLGSSERIWFHCASYGEFEQGRTLMEAVKKDHPGHKIILSFFSPSGYEAFRNWNGADIVCYLPLDTPKNAADFIEIVNPKTVIFIKYEFWINFLFRLKEKSIPSFLVSAVFKDHHPFFKWYGKIFRRSLHTFEKLFIQDQNSAELLEKIQINDFEICGDTRFDRVLEIKANFKPLPFFEEFCGKNPVLVAGSTWPGDEELLVSAFLKLGDANLKLIIAPHQVDEKAIQNLRQLLEKNGLAYLLYSKQIQDLSKQILIVDTIGILSKLYHYASVAYIGGGFDSGIHNCLEPAVYLKPTVFFGDDFAKYNEAVDLVKLKAAKNVMDATELEFAVLNYMNNQMELDEIKTNLEEYFALNSGTTTKVMNLIDWT